MYVYAQGIAVSTTVLVGGKLYVSSGGTANSTTVNSSGRMYVSSGGTATGIVENGGYVHVSGGASATFIPNSFSGLVVSNCSATVHSGTTAVSTVITSGGYMRVYPGGIVNSLVVSSDCYLHGGAYSNVAGNPYIITEMQAASGAHL